MRDLEIEEFEDSKLDYDAYHLMLSMVGFIEETYCKTSNSHEGAIIQDDEVMSAWNRACEITGYRG